MADSSDENPYAGRYSHAEVDRHEAITESWIASDLRYIRHTRAIFDKDRPARLAEAEERARQEREQIRLMREGARPEPEPENFSQEFDRMFAEFFPKPAEQRRPEPAPKPSASDDDLEKLSADIRESGRWHDARDKEAKQLLSVKRKAKRSVEPDDFAREFADAAAERARSDYAKAYAKLASRCESPIEKILAAALIHAFNDTWAYVCPGANRFFMGGGYVWPEDGASDFNGCFIYQQAAVGKYRADFLIRLIEDDKRHTLVIECDGHDYHERSKEQAGHDRSRDRWMTAQGITVLRFTGAEIWRDPVACVNGISDVIFRLLGLDEDQP